MSVFHLNYIYYCTKDRNKTISGLLNDRKVPFSEFSFRKDIGIKKQNALTAELWGENFLRLKATFKKILNIYLL